MVLFRMLNRGVFNDVNGCISTGKEVCHSFSIIIIEVAPPTCIDRFVC